MGSITPGVNGTLKSNTLENALYEALNIALIWENDTTKNPNNERNITLTEDRAAKRITASFDFKITRERTANGATSFPVQTALVSTGYAVGTGTTNVSGTTVPPSIISTNIYAAIVEICEEIQRRDNDQVKNPQGLNTVTALNYDSEALTVTGSISMVVDFSTDSTGSVVSRARTYLID